MRTTDPDAHAKVRRRILIAARGRFAAAGYHATSMNEVAEAAGMAKAAVYHYFKGKRALLQAMHEDVYTEAEVKLGRAPRFKNLRAALTYLGREHLSHFKERGAAEVMRIALTAHSEDPGLLRLCSGVIQPRMENLLDGFLEPYFPKGSPPGEARRRLLPFFGGLFYYQFVLLRSCDPRHLPSEAEYLDNLVDVFSRAARRQKPSGAGSIQASAAA
jgi:AcrR family transcriptional regulator